MKKIFIGLAVFLIMLIAGTIVLYRRSVAPYNNSKNQAFEYAMTHSEIITPEEFYWYNDSETFFAVVGKTEEETELVVLINQDNGETTSIPAEETITKQQAIQRTREARQPEKILEARIGMDNNTPIWEVSYRNENGRLGYYILNLEDGEWLKTIDNI